MLSQLGRFDEAIGHAEVAVRLTEAADHPFTLYWGLFDPGHAHPRRGDLPHANRVLARCLDLCQAWQIIVGIPVVTVVFGAGYALADRADEGLPQIAPAVEGFRRRPLVTHCHLGLGKLNRHTGKREQARAYLTAVAALYREMDMRFWREQVESAPTELA